MCYVHDNKQMFSRHSIPRILSYRTKGGCKLVATKVYYTKSILQLIEWDFINHSVFAALTHIDETKTGKMYSRVAIHQKNVTANRRKKQNQMDNLLVTWETTEKSNFSSNNDNVIATAFAIANQMSPNIFILRWNC